MKATGRPVHARACQPAEHFAFSIRGLSFPGQDAQEAAQYAKLHAVRRDVGDLETVIYDGKHKRKVICCICAREIHAGETVVVVPLCG